MSQMPIGDEVALTYTALVFQRTIGGTIYWIAAGMYNDGLRVITPPSSTDPALMIEAAWSFLNGLGGGELVTRGAGQTWICQTTIDSQGDNITWKSDWSLVLTCKNALNNPVVDAQHNYITFQGLHINGNAANQAVPDGTHSCGIITGGPPGWSSSYVYIDHCYIHDTRQFGVWFRNGTGCGVLGSLLPYNRWNGIQLGSNVDALNVFAINNNVSHSGDVGIAADGKGALVIGNHVHDMDGVNGSGAAWWGIAEEGFGYATISDNIVYNVSSGIVAATSGHNLITGNRIWDWDTDAGDYYAIRLISPYNFVFGNTAETARATGTGCTLASDYNRVIGNNFVVNAAKIAIRVPNNSDNCTILDNVCSGGTGISIEANCDNTRVFGNDLRLCTTKIIDLGNNTQMPTVRACFVKELGTAAWIVTAAAPMGVDIDAANEGALAGRIKLPSDLQQLVRIKVCGTAQVAEADGMRLDLEGMSGVDNESGATGEVISVTKTSSTLNFANLDEITWVFTPADDVDIGHLTADDRLQICCYYAIAAGADCATDLLLSGEEVEIQYV